MKIIGFTINKITAEQKKLSGNKVEIKSNLSIDNITEDKVEMFNASALKFDFSYIVNYEPNIAQIVFKGSVLGLDDKGEGKEILKDWKDKKFKNDVRIAIVNYIMESCILKALNLEKELGLPLHLPFPKFKKEDGNPANYTG